MSLFVLAVAAASGCSASKGLTAGDAALDGGTVGDDRSDVVRPDVAVPIVTPPDAMTYEAGIPCVPGTEPAASTDGSVSSRSDADPQLPANLVAPAPPEICCDVTAGAAACDLPPSGCAMMAGVDASLALTNWIVFYENPRCVAGRCVWDQSYFQCQVSSTCRNGACAFLGTALP